MDTIHGGDVVSRAVVVKQVSIAAIGRRDPPSVQLCAFGRAEVDILIGKWRVVCAAVSVAGLTSTLAGGCGYQRKRVGGGYIDGNYNDCEYVS